MKGSTFVPFPSFFVAAVIARVTLFRGEVAVAVPCWDPGGDVGTLGCWGFGGVEGGACAPPAAEGLLGAAGVAATGGVAATAAVLEADFVVLGFFGGDFLVSGLAVESAGLARLRCGVVWVSVVVVPAAAPLLAAAVAEAAAGLALFCFVFFRGLSPVVCVAVEFSGSFAGLDLFPSPFFGDGLPPFPAPGFFGVFGLESGLPFGVLAVLFPDVPLAATGIM